MRRSGLQYDQQDKSDNSGYMMDATLRDNMSVTCSLESAAPNKGLRNSDRGGTELLQDCLGKSFPKTLIFQERLLTTKVQEQVGASGAMKGD